jgi:hypothetical protein
MCRREAIPEPWRSFLNELERIATTTVRLDCIGGFVVTMLYGLSRPTADTIFVNAAYLNESHKPLAPAGQIRVIDL